MTTAPRSNVRARLRGATQDAHARVDGCFPQGLADAGDYRRYLRGMHAVLQALDLGLAAPGLPASWQAWRRPERTGWLLEDLADTGNAPLAGGPALALSGGAEAAGALYVMEGSALGATRLLGDAHALGLSGDKGARFLHGHGGESSGARWRDYLRCLEEANFDPGDEETLFAAARRTFAFAELQFSRAAQPEATT